ncbi:HK97 family phage portal protein [Rhodoligotrophos appendicifer]|uniref:phage portal protein n=1 Tax=Rhodoligotrophos appendicifer TaxID=987056 RepID=UPI00118522C5|nr:phage portal protein [Rhodoligotrophos appendicifer]
MLKRLRKLVAGQARMAPDVKRSATGPLIALHVQGQPVWTPRNYADLAREGFTQNAVGYRCVRMIAEAAASVPWLLYEGERELTQHPLLDLLSAPHPGASGVDLFELAYGYLQTAGNSYLEAVSIGGQVRELHALRPDRMQVVAGPNGWPDGFDYTASGQTVRFDQRTVGQRPILHLRLFNPSNDHYGLSPFEPAARSIDVHSAAGAWNKGLLDNAARPSGALVYGGADGASLSEEQFSRLKQELEQSYQGAANAGRPLVLEGGLDWKSMGYSPKDMDFIGAKDVAAREIALAFGVPPMLLGIPGDNTFSNYAEANRVFWRQTVLPLVGRTARALTLWLAPGFGHPLRLWYDADQVEALTAEREGLWARVGAADFLSQDEKRAAVGYGPQAG